MGVNQAVVTAATFNIKNACFDNTIKLVKAQGTVDGVQYDDEVVTVLADTDYELLLFKTEDFLPRLKGTLAWVEYYISFELKAGSGTADLKWKLQARNKDGTWTDMCAEQSADNIGAVYVAKVIQGLLDIKTNITEIPFEMRLIFQSNETAPGIATGRVKNDTAIRSVGSVGGIG